MKTNETPEKIYINSNLENRTWLIGKGDISFIEYTRTDTVIEKACEWLNKELPITDLSSSNMLDITFNVFDKESKKVFIESFRKYMEKK